MIAHLFKVSLKIILGIFRVEFDVNNGSWNVLK